jgi:hypothetical protein
MEKKDEIRLVAPAMVPAISFLHNGTIGDVIASIPAMQEVYRKNGFKLRLYLQNGQTAKYYDGATHPTRAKDGKTMVMLNRDAIDMIAPLILAQECFEVCKEWENEQVQVDLNRIREMYSGMPNLCLSRWYFQVYPDMACDLSKKWLTVPETDKDLAKGKIIVTRTERYLNPLIDYFFLKSYEKDVLFVGTELEYLIFKHRFNLNIERLVIKDLLELAQALSQCLFHVSNQTMAFQISQGLKIPRIVELCAFAPNVIVIGEDAYDFYSQGALEYYVSILYKKTRQRN